MLKKAYRLWKNEIKKVLKYKKAFFSAGWIANTTSNRLGHNRFAVFFSGKNTKTSISRNFFRRKFYDLVKTAENQGAIDTVFIPKKGKTFDKTRKDDIVTFENDIKYLLRAIQKWGTEKIIRQCPRASK